MGFVLPHYSHFCTSRQKAGDIEHFANTYQHATNNYVLNFEKVEEALIIALG